MAKAPHLNRPYEAVTDVLADYFDALYESDAAKLSRVFHPLAHYVCVSDGTLQYLRMNEYLPKTVKRTVRPFDPVAHVVAGAAVIVARARTPGRYEATVDARDAATIELNAHWFPGWRASVDGVEQSIGPGENGFDDGGLIRVRVASGHHVVALRYARTALRWACDATSLLTLVFVLLLLLRGVSAFGARRRRRATG